jgi:hypothetical protein
VSSASSLGLTWWEAVLATYFGAFLAAIVITGEFQSRVFIFHVHP